MKTLKYDSHKKNFNFKLKPKKLHIFFLICIYLFGYAQSQCNRQVPSLWPVGSSSLIRNEHWLPSLGAQS